MAPDANDPNFGDGNPSHDIEKEEAAQKEAPVQEAPHEVEKRERLSELAAHPHTQLRGLISDLNSPAAKAADITTKHAMLHSAVVRLIQQILQHTPPPGDSVEKINEDFERQQQHAQGAEQEKPGAL